MIKLLTATLGRSTHHQVTVAASKSKKGQMISEENLIPLKQIK